MKRGFTLLFALLLISNVSAATIDRYIDTSSLLLIGVMLIVFYISYAAVNKTMLRANTGTKIFFALVIALFTTWKVHTSDFRINSFVFDLGLTEFLESFGPMILIIGLAIAMFMWGIPGVLIIAGAAINLIGFIGQGTQTIYNAWFLNAVGIMMMIGGVIWIGVKHRKKVSEMVEPLDVTNTGKSSCTLFTIIGFLGIITGIFIGNITIIIIALLIFILGLICPWGKTTFARKRQLVKLKKSVYGDFNYEHGMRRGGLHTRKWLGRKGTRKSNKGIWLRRAGKADFVNKRAARKYARRYGNRAARRRFGRGFDR